MSSPRMPALFLGHGSPMNVLEDNRYTRTWQRLGQTLPRPEAILAISAHWYTQGTAVTAMAQPRTVHDFGGFPQALFDQRYSAPPALAQRVQSLLAPVPVHADTAEWGLDHGTWGVLIKMYPEADIPVVQLSLDATRDAAYHFALGEKLAVLCDEGVMLVASGNVVHNLRTVRWQDDAESYPWAISFDQFVRDHLSAQGEPHPLINYRQHQDAALSNPSPEHFLPLLYVLGSRVGDEPVSVPVDGITLGSISMLSVQVG